ncbi:MAG: hypothetical protein AAGI30_06580 [Planctomycetota bacterium]
MRPARHQATSPRIPICGLLWFTVVAAPLAVSPGCYERVVRREGAFTQSSPVYERSDEDLFLLKDLENLGRELSGEDSR